MSVADDIVAGIVCMNCLQFLISSDGKLNESDCPTLCEECWRAAPKSDRNAGLAYFDEATGDLSTEWK